MTRLGSLMEETILVYGCIKMHALLVWKGLAKALRGRETFQQWCLMKRKMNLEKAHNTSLLCLANEILCDVQEDSAAKLWLKLESSYMMEISCKLLVFAEMVAHCPDESRHSLKTTLMSLIKLLQIWGMVREFDFGLWDILYMPLSLVPLV